jgi:hypothetical protein
MPRTRRRSIVPRTPLHRVTSTRRRRRRRIEKESFLVEIQGVGHRSRAQRAPSALYVRQSGYQ